MEIGADPAEARGKPSGGKIVVTRGRRLLMGVALVRDILVTLCGLMVLLVPLLLWVAWSKWLFWLIMAGGCTALLVIYVLIWTAPDERF
jgi:hypothetical protein